LSIFEIVATNFRFSYVNLFLPFQIDRLTPPSTVDFFHSKASRSALCLPNAPRNHSKHSQLFMFVDIWKRLAKRLSMRRKTIKINTPSTVSLEISPCNKMRSARPMTMVVTTIGLYFEYSSLTAAWPMTMVVYALIKLIWLTSQKDIHILWFYIILQIITQLKKNHVCVSKLGKWRDE
jgi:hypothetical protein